MPREIRLYNTLTGSTDSLRPILPEQVSVYTCGPTVYADAHLGNYRSFLFEDVLVRVLRRFGYTVKRVMNITDVGHLTSDADTGEDKLEIGARREGRTAWEVARFYEQSFIQAMQALNMEIPDPLVRATDTIDKQIALIQNIQDKGFTYQTDDGIYFESSKLPDYGKLAHLDVAGLQAGIRVDMNQKHQPTDFALWKFSPKDTKRDMEWESPWGKGFPGWHIECSAIILATLGEEIDIHTGGVDHISVHHTNEIAQTQVVTGKPLARHWLHGEFLLINGGKMAKSAGDEYYVRSLSEKGFDPLAYRLFCFSASYRTKLNFTWEGLAAAQTSLERLRAAVQGNGKVEPTDQDASNIAEWIERIDQALSDDLNMPQVIALLWELLRSQASQGVKQAVAQSIDTIVQLDLFKPVVHVELPIAIAELVTQRDAAREAKDWGSADKLRVALNTQGYSVEDSANGTVVKKGLTSQ